MTNYGTLAILALGPMPESELRLLLALETVPADASGRRKIGMRLLAESAAVPYGTARVASDRLAARGLVEYVAGSGRGNFTTWRLLFPLKVPAHGEHLSGAERCSTEPVKVLSRPAKGARRNAVTSANENTALEPSALEPSALSARAREIAGRLAKLGATEREIADVVDRVRANPRISNADAYLSAALDNGDGRALLDQVRAGDHRSDSVDVPWEGMPYD